MAGLWPFWPTPELLCKLSMLKTCPEQLSESLYDADVASGSHATLGTRFISGGDVKLKNLNFTRKLIQHACLARIKSEVETLQKVA